MTQAQRVVSKGYYLAFNGVEISGDYTKFDWEGQIDTVDLTANNDEASYHKGTTKRYAYSASMFYRGAAGSAVCQALVESTEGTITWGPEGTASGKPKGSALGIVKSFKHSSGGQNAAQTIDVTWDPQGGLISDPRTATW